MNQLQTGSGLVADRRRTLIVVELDWKQIRLGLGWDQTGIILGSDWDQTGTRLGSDWDQTAIRLGSEWD